MDNRVVNMIQAVARSRKRSRHERALLARTAVLFACAHALLRAAQLSTARKRLAAIARTLGAHAKNAQQLTWVIDAVHRNLPGHHSCLIDAMCCEAIAANSGIASEFKLGAARGAERMHFHAWVEHHGRIIAGAHDGEFTAFR